MPTAAPTHLRPAALLGAALIASVVSHGCASGPPVPVTAIDVEPPRPPAPRRGDEEGPEDAPILVFAEDPADDFVIEQDGTRRTAGEGFAYQRPASWEELDPATLGSHLIRCAQRNTQAVDGFMTNVNVASEPFVGDGPAYADANLVELRKVSTIRDQRAARAGDRPASDIEAYWPNPGGVPYVTLQRYATDGSDGFVITCSAAASAFERERPTCARILDSFRVE